MERRSRAGEVEDPVECSGERLDDVVLDKPKTRLIHERREVLHPAGREIVEAGHAVAFGKKPLAEVRSKEPGSAGDENTHLPGLTTLRHDRIAPERDAIHSHDHRV